MIEALFIELKFKIVGEAEHEHMMQTDKDYREWGVKFMHKRGKKIEEMG